MSDNIYSSREKMLENVPKLYCNRFKRAWSGRSQQAAIRAHCLMCMGFNQTEVDKCTAVACPLYEYRNTKAFSKHKRNVKSRAAAKD